MHRVEYGGTFEKLQSAINRLSIVVPVTLLLIIGLLIMALGTIRDAGVIFTGVPLALSGGIISLTLLTLVVLPALYRLVHVRDEREVVAIPGN